MKKTKLLKQILIILVILLILNIGEVNASLQSNPNTQYTKTNTRDNWMIDFRQMEIVGETMGLSETLNSDLTASSESNQIDVHMIRTTEYGATAILSASAYGNPDNSNTMTTTTGNDTGVKKSQQWELTAGGLTDKIFIGVNRRYYDEYGQTQASARVGDALGNATTNNPGCARWHGATNYGWVSSRGYTFAHGYKGIFSFDWSGNGNVFCARGVVVCGVGI